MTEQQLQPALDPVRVVGRAVAVLTDGGSFTVTDAMVRAVPDLEAVTRALEDLVAAYPEYVWTSTENLMASGRSTTIAWTRRSTIPHPTGDTP